MLKKYPLISLINDQADLLYITAHELSEMYPAFRFAVDEAEARPKLGQSVYVYLMSDETVSLMQLTAYAQGYLRGIQRSV